MIPSTMKTKIFSLAKNLTKWSTKKSLNSWKKEPKPWKNVAKRFKIPYLKNQRFAETKKKCEQTDLIKKS